MIMLYQDCTIIILPRHKKICLRGLQSGKTTSLVAQLTLCILIDSSFWFDVINLG